MKKPANVSAKSEVVFLRLRAILENNRDNLAVSEDSAARYCLAGGCHPTHKKPFPIAWVEINKNYVSFHHMGVYCSPGLLADASKKLKARMQGKSCFNFNTVDEALFEELEQLTPRAFEMLKLQLARLSAKPAASAKAGC